MNDVAASTLLNRIGNNEFTGKTIGIARLSQQGLRLADYLKYIGGDEAKFREGFKEQAEKQVKMRLALEAVAKAENIQLIRQINNRIFSIECQHDRCESSKSDENE